MRVVPRFHDLLTFFLKAPLKLIDVFLKKMLDAKTKWRHRDPKASGPNS